MSARLAGGWRTGAIALVLAAALLGGQAVADASVAPGDRTAAGAPVGRAGFAYMTGLRRFAAILLFNRLEPQYHEFYGGLGMDQLKFLMPSFYIITWLDPQYIQPYYDATWILYRGGRIEEALALARQSVADNPNSGLLHIAYAQLLYFRKRDVPEQVRQCDLAMRADVVWADAAEQWEALMIIKDIYSKAGLPAKAQRAVAIAKSLDVDPADAPGLRDPSQQF